MDPKQVGEIICSNRKKLKMTQKELADKIGVTDKAVSKWERGIGLPDINTIVPLAECLQISIAEIMIGEGKNTLPSENIVEAENKALKLSLEYAQEKIRSAIRCCIPALIVSWVVMVIGVCFMCTVQEIWIRCIAISLLIISTQLSGRVLVELMRQGK